MVNRNAFLSLFITFARVGSASLWDALVTNWTAEFCHDEDPYPVQRTDTQLDSQQRNGGVVGFQTDALFENFHGTGWFPSSHQRQGELVPQMELLKGKLHGSLQTLWEQRGVHTFEVKLHLGEQPLIKIVEVMF